jgi:hypothetical protein
LSKTDDIRASHGEKAEIGQQNCLTLEPVLTSVAETAFCSGIYKTGTDCKPDA